MPKAPLHKLFKENPSLGIIGVEIKVGVVMSLVLISSMLVFNESETFLITWKLRQELSTACCRVMSGVLPQRLHGLPLTQPWA